ncbi:heavy metal translocating P-type ATPase [Cohnella terricola]|uniref:P-type Cu(+) transporter n=1 Tax=Cohnella terricola TaxID=1289167 RepID=A0A559JQ20_9BACL|nr:cation-translocating P-type ATPase [Cohnella terricola]TVY01985.1 cadmium-translocating P-type ATPase [Cohnella terricola]
MDTLRLQVQGMTCAACAVRIEKGLRRLEGVQQATVNMATAQAYVQYDPQLAGETAIRRKIEQLGYGTAGKEATPHEAYESEIRSLRSRFLLSLALSFPLLWGMLAHYPGLHFVWIPHILHSPFLQWGLASALQFYVGYSFYYGAYQSLKLRSANMDTLVALSTSVAYFYSHYLLFASSFTVSHEHLYFDTVAMIITVVLLGKFLEAKAKGRALKDLNELYGLQIRFVRVKKRNAEDWIPTEALRQGDQVVVLAGEWISADGKVVSGAAEVDEALLTGESMPILKTSGDEAYSGTRCLNGSLIIRAECAASETRLSRMIAMVEEAQSLKPTIARKVDKAAAIFVPLMVLCAAITYAAWSLIPEAPAPAAAIRYALAVLLIACPCALGLAAPVSILIATALSAKQGILFKNGSAMESLAKVDRILFDKTGTLTEGKPVLTSIQPVRHTKSYLLRMAAAIERHSAHPLGQAIALSAEQQRILFPEAKELLEVPGGGMQGVVEGKLVRVGHPKWIQADSSYEKSAPSVRASESGETALYISIDHRPAGTFVLSDMIRSDAFAVIERLKRNASLGMVTGDQSLPANVIARQSGIEEVYSACSPDRKAEIVNEYRRNGNVVAFVGDGNNDAAALASANVGIAMSGGAGAAMETGDVVLTRNRLTGIADAIEISKQALKNIRQNIGFAIGYNVLAVPLAAFGFLDPRIACMGMTASSIFVVTNALRLRRTATAGREPK